MQTDAPLDFTNINYLREGTPRQKEVFHLLQSHAILERLHQYQPLLIGSIPIGVDIPGSDIDISCGYQHLEDFRTTLLQLFSGEDQFQLRQRHFNNLPTLVANFYIPPFPIEIFGQPIPPAKQYGYRHMIIEHKLLLQNGTAFRQSVIALKTSGLNTEAAFCQLLGLQGDPFTSLLALEDIK